MPTLSYSYYANDFCFMLKNSSPHKNKQTITMTGLQLMEKTASYILKADDSVLINSPIFITKYNKGQIGIHLRGLRKPDNRLNVRFISGSNIQAIKLDWTLDGAILYVQVMKDKLINVGQHIGTIRWQPFQQLGKMQAASHSIKFQT